MLWGCGTAPKTPSSALVDGNPQRPNQKEVAGRQQETAKPQAVPAAQTEKTAKKQPVASADGKTGKVFAPVTTDTNQTIPQSIEAAKKPVKPEASSSKKRAAVLQNGISDSLWYTNNSLGSLFVSQKAHHVGDIITIHIVESSSATNEATTSTGRDSSISIQTPKFFGAENDVKPEWLFDPLGELSAGFGSGFDGEGSTQRKGDLTAYITAKVTEVLPNGNLKILGTREIAINNEKQFIHISGIIRSRDISTDNIIQSTYIADAKIDYSGTGVINDRQKPGWLTSFLNKIWPF
jgi:flagellar L-ring protein precursor FlgH